MITGKSIKLFTIYGFDIKIDLSWFFLAALITVSLSMGYFPYYYKNFSLLSYWAMGISCAFLIFFSILFHEFCHSLIAKKMGIPITGITLFLLGGVAEMNDSPPNPKSEILMSAAGPISSIFLGVVFYLLSILGNNLLLPIEITGVLLYASIINFVLAFFNSIPAFPLDGGRILRSIIWHYNKNIIKATRISSKIGSFFGFFLIFWGILNIFSANILGGFWLLIIGFFLKTVASLSYKQTVIRSFLEGETVSNFMNKDIISVSQDTSIYDFIHQFLFKYRHSWYPVLDGVNLKGFIQIDDLKNLKNNNLISLNISNVMHETTDEITISPEKDVFEALDKMKKHDKSHLLIVKENYLQGIFTIKDFVHFLMIKSTLAGEDPLLENYSQTFKKA